MTERPVRALKFQGFGLGIWNWPILNILLERVGSAGVRRSSTTSTSTSKTTYSNIEEYSIFEDKPGVIRVRIHRKAERD